VSSRLRRWPIEVAIAIDQLAGAICLGPADETLSSRAWKAKLKGKLKGRIAVPIIDALAYVVTFGRRRRHCRDSVERDEGGWTWDEAGKNGPPDAAA
jgi:hypothetical protein